MAVPSSPGGRPERIVEHAPLAPLTTLELGGPARYLLEAHGEAEVRHGLRWARGAGIEVAVLGGGSNVVVADAGFDGLVIRPAMAGVTVRPTPSGTVLVTAAAGEGWDELVERAVAARWAGLECLSGIPGRVGATPVGNVGAYGQEVGDTVVSVRAVDTLAGAPGGPGALVEIDAPGCGFSYRSSELRRQRGRFVVLAVTFSLTPGGAPALRYPELRRALGEPVSPPPLQAVRDAVLDLRRSKSMLLDPDDPNRRSAGSFFTNPVVPDGTADEVARRALACGAVARAEEVPRHVAGPGLAKLSAAWLIERAGFARGLCRGQVGISTRHCLALVHHGSGTAAELVALAREVRAGVHGRFGVWLSPEPCFLGFDVADPVTA